jgi:hypothetical protein
MIRVVVEGAAELLALMMFIAMVALWASAFATAA